MAKSVEFDDVSDKCVVKNAGFRQRLWHLGAWQPPKVKSKSCIRLRIFPTAGDSLAGRENASARRVPQNSRRYSVRRFRSANVDSACSTHRLHDDVNLSLLRPRR